MKRTNVILDEKLLEDARRELGEKTYSATITKALEKVMRRKRFWDLYDKFAEEAAKGDFFWPGYLEEIRPAGRMTRLQKKGAAGDASRPSRKKTVAAHEVRVPRKKKSSSRGSR